MDKEGADSSRTVPEKTADERRSVYSKMVETLLMPDAYGMVRKDRLVEFFQKTLGNMFSDDKAKEVLDSLKCDGSNMIRLECFLKAFAEKYCTEDTLAGIVQLLESQPEEMEHAWDWKGMLSNVGVELSDEDLREAVLAAKNLAEMLLTKKHPEGCPVPVSEEGDGPEGNIYQTVRENLHLMGLGEKSGEGKETKRKPEEN